MCIRDRYITAPNATLELSVCTTNGLLKSANYNTGGDIMLSLSVSNAAWCRVVHSNFVPFFLNAFNGAAISARWGMYL